MIHTAYTGISLMRYRYNRLLYVIDTCQANSMYSKFYSQNIISTGSSMVGENSYSVSPASLTYREMLR